MHKTSVKALLISASALLLMSTGIPGASAHMTHHRYQQHYIVDVFPSKATHENFDYQLRKGNYAHIYEANLHDHIGHHVFGYYGHKRPSRVYEHRLQKHHYNKWHELKSKLESNKHKSNNNVIVFNKSYNTKQIKKLIKHLHKHYHHLIFKPDIIMIHNHKIQHGLLIGLHKNNRTRMLMNKIHQYNYAKLSQRYQKKHPRIIKWYKHNVVQSQDTMNNSVLEHYRQHHHDNKVIEVLGLTASQIANN